MSERECVWLVLLGPRGLPSFGFANLNSFLVSDVSGANEYWQRKKESCEQLRSMQFPWKNFFKRARMRTSPIESVRPFLSPARLSLDSIRLPRCFSDLIFAWVLSYNLYVAARV